MRTDDGLLRIRFTLDPLPELFPRVAPRLTLKDALWFSEPPLTPFVLVKSGYTGTLLPLSTPEGHASSCQTPLMCSPSPDSHGPVGANSRKSPFSRPTHWGDAFATGTLPRAELYPHPPAVFFWRTFFD